MSILTAIEILPLIGSLVIAFSPKDNAKLVKQIALGTSLLVAVVSVLMAVKFDKSADWYQTLEDEMMRFPRDKHDDQVDALSWLGLIVDQVQTADTPEEEEEYEF